MTPNERLLLMLLERMGPDRNARAVMLQSYMAEEEPLSEEAAAKVRKLLGGG